MVAAVCCLLRPIHHVWWEREIEESVQRHWERETLSPSEHVGMAWVSHRREQCMHEIRAGRTIETNNNSKKRRMLER